MYLLVLLKNAQQNYYNFPNFQSLYKNLTHFL